MNFTKQFFAWAQRIAECNAWFPYNIHGLRMGMSENSVMIDLAAFVARSANINGIT